MRRRRRRLPRILLNAATALSLVLCVAAVTLWGRSYWRQDYVRWRPIHGPERGFPYFRFESGGGGVQVAGGVQDDWLSERRDGPAGWSWRSHGRPSFPVRGLPPAGRRLGYAWFKNSMGKFYALSMPTGLVAGLFALLPASRLAAKVLRRRRRPPGLCPTCNYDLRATPDRCPECGAVSPPPA